MSLSSIQYVTFRNLNDCELDTRAKRIFLVGENGQGKTNLLEALYYVSYGASFRGMVDSQIPTAGSVGFSVAAKINTFQSTMPDDYVRVDWSRQTKEIRRSGKLLKDRKELIELNPTVLFGHEDFLFASGEPERRRAFFDQTEGLVSIEYIDSLRRYKKILKQRNMALRTANLQVLDFLDIQMVQYGIELTHSRVLLCQYFNSLFSSIYESVARLGKTVCVSYQPSWKPEYDASELLLKLKGRRNDELVSCTSVSGPHRDRWSFQTEDGDFVSTASTGQIRLLSLALRITQAKYFTERTGRTPVLLLDDVLLELDPGKRVRFFECLPEYSQAFFTFLPGEPWEDYRSSDTMIYYVENGRFSN